MLLFLCTFLCTTGYEFFLYIAVIRLIHFCKYVGVTVYIKISGAELATIDFMKTHRG